MDLQAFCEGKEFDAYTYYGAHVKGSGVEFRVYAPNARNISIEGDFNNWSEYYMDREESGSYYAFFENAKAGMYYKYKIYGQDQSVVYHSDPYGYGTDMRPEFASVIVDIQNYEYDDEIWMKNRDKNYNKAMNIYEVHLGSWRKKGDGEKDWYQYDEIAEMLIPYVKENGFTHIEIMPLCEHPADCSWGYQTTGFYSPTSRYGSALQLMKLIDQCHQAGIGVIMDFVPVHFAVDSYGLGRFDGSHLYEYPYEDVGKSQWGTYNFNFARGEVRSFLQSSVNYWISVYHIDGIRMDAISNVLYWQGNAERGINQSAVDFIKDLNQEMGKRHPDVMMIAEDSTTYPKVTAPVEYDGLGFDYKWDMGFMNDTLEYMKIPPKERHNSYHKLTFSMHYFYYEHFILPFSHDENVHGKATILQKMWGDYDQKFDQCRLLYAYMFTHPGKKLNFMGAEIGHFREWDEKREQDWCLLDFPKHRQFYRFFGELSRYYRDTAALYDGEYSSAYFKWITCDCQEDCIYAYIRGRKKRRVIVVLNFSDEDYPKYCIPMLEKIKMREKINTDWDIYGGSTLKKRELIISKTDELKKESIVLHMAPFSARIFEVL